VTKGRPAQHVRVVPGDLRNRMIAGIALATRNVKPFADLGLEIMNLWGG
jgi:hypothetical protein